MSEIRLRTGGHTVVVTVAAEGDGFAATVDGAAHRVAGVVPTTVASVGGATVETVDVVVDGRAWCAVVARIRDRIHVGLDGHTWVFERVDDALGGGAGAGSGSVAAPMPGKVVKVFVAAGDKVTAGQALVVLEAMKMETTLVAEIDGIVATIAAEAGAMVDAGTIVVEIDAATI